jgi:hypothetical protein
MDYSTYLTTMAQIAGVLVGFANLANAISRPGISAGDLKLNKLRIIITTESGLILMGLCVLPLLFSTSQFLTSDIFRGLSLLGAFIAALYHSLLFVRVKVWTGKTFPLSISKYFHFANVLLLFGPYLLNAFGVFGIENSVFVYCSVTFGLFIILCVFFCRLLYSVIPAVDKHS